MPRCWLLQPLQGGIQATIDQRFSRCKYDVARTLAAFSATLRHEVDLRQLSEQVVALVEGYCHWTWWIIRRAPANASRAQFSLIRLDR